MRLAALGLFLTSALLAGCSGTPPQRTESTDIKGTVKLPGGKSAKGLTVSLRPTEDALPAGGKCGADGSFTLKAAPGKYLVYFDQEANASVPAYKDVPQSYRTASMENAITVSAGTPLNIEVK